MATIKIIWKDGTESYARGMGCYTPFKENAKQYRSILIAGRTARQIQNFGELVKDVIIQSNGKEYRAF